MPACSLPLYPEGFQYYNCTFSSKVCGVYFQFLPLSHCLKKLFGFACTACQLKYLHIEYIFFWWSTCFKNKTFFSPFDEAFNVIFFSLWITHCVILQTDFSCSIKKRRHRMTRVMLILWCTSTSLVFNNKCQIFVLRKLWGKWQVSISAGEICNF